MAVKKKALRRLYPQGSSTRHHFHTTIPDEVMDRLREVVVVGRGGEAAPLVTLSLELTTAVLALNDLSLIDGAEWQDGVTRLQEASRKLASIGDPASVATALRIAANEADPHRD